MEIPWSHRKKALLIIDVQPGFLNSRNDYIVRRIARVIQDLEYDLLLESVFHAESGSLWETQTHWTLPADRNFKTVDELALLLARREHVHLEKSTKSAYKGDPDLEAELKRREIEEVHIVGLDVNDCVLATALESFDRGFFTYVLEECAESSGTVKVRDAGIDLLRYLNMTNRSCVEAVRYIDIESSPRHDDSDSLQRPVLD